METINKRMVKKIKQLYKENSRLKTWLGEKYQTVLEEPLTKHHQNVLMDMQTNPHVRKWFEKLPSDARSEDIEYTLTYDGTMPKTEYRWETISPGVITRNYDGLKKGVNPDKDDNVHLKKVYLRNPNTGETWIRYERDYNY